MDVVIVNGGKELPGRTGSGRVQGTCWPAMLQVQPLPWAVCGVKPAGTVSVTLTGPVVGPAVGSSETTVVNDPVLPSWKMPFGVITVCRSGGSALMVRLDTSWMLVLFPVEPANPNFTVCGSAGWPGVSFRFRLLISVTMPLP